VHLQMTGATAFNSAATTASVNVSHIGTAAQSANRSTGRMGGIMSKAAGGLAFVGQTAGAAATALGGAALAATGLGLKFNASMEQSKVAFTNLLGNADAAQSMLDKLYDVAAHTPFEFPQLTQATQRLLGFGMAAKDVIPTMTAIGDAVAASGGGAEQIDRVSTALGQMQAKGKVSSEELLQLAESGVPALKILGDQLGLTGAQLSDKLKKGAISANVGIKALTTGMEKRYKGMAASQSKTFSGMISTLKDSATQILGMATKPLFDYLKNTVLPVVVRITDALGKWVKAGGITHVFNALRAGFSGKSTSETAGYTGALGTVVKVGRVVGQVFAYLKTTVSQLMDALKPMAPFIQNILWPVLKGALMGALAGIMAQIKMTIPVIKIIATVLGWLGTQAAPLGPAITKVSAAFSYFATGGLAVMMIPALTATGRALASVGRFIWMLMTPIRMLISAWIKLGGVVLDINRKMSSAIAELWSKIKAATGRVIDGFKQFGRDIIRAVVDGIKSAPGVIIDAIKSLLPGKAAKLLGKVLPGFATGGVMRAGTVGVVGERGPEIVSADRTVRIIPIPSTGPVASLSGGVAGGDIIVPVNIDGREVTRVVARRTDDRRARR
jgi:tape measure domain-containing protein